MLPSGWFEASVGWRVALARHHTRLELGVGMPGIQVRAEGVLRMDRLALAPWSLSVRRSLLRREPPNLSVSMVGQVWVPGQEGQSVGTVVGVGVRRQFGPVRLTVWTRGGIGAAPPGLHGIGEITLDLGLQVGPVLVEPKVAIANHHRGMPTPWRASVGGEVWVQFSRGVELVGGGWASRVVEGQLPWSPAGWVDVRVRR